MKSNVLRQAWYIGLLDSLQLLRDPMLLIVLSLISFLPTRRAARIEPVEALRSV